MGNDKPNTPVDQCPITSNYELTMSQSGVADAKSVDDYSILRRDKDLTC